MISLKSQRNPYIIGRPINEPELFCGRQKQLSFVEENLRRGEKVIVLHGERRIGKSSLLQNIPKFVKLDKFKFVSFDLEYHSQETLESLLEKLAEAIVEQLSINTQQVEIPRAEKIKVQKDIFCNKFLPQIYARLKDTKLVLLLDEFDALEPTYIGATLESLFGQLKSVVENNKRLFAVIFAGRKSTDITNLLKIFKSVPIAEVGLLDETSVQQLIIDPASNLLKYTPESIQAIIKLSSGHPYFTQIICFAIFSRARELEKWEVNQEDVEAIVEASVELAEAGLAWYWEALSIPEKVVFSAVAEAERIVNEKHDQRLSQDPLMLLKSYNLLSKNELKLVTKELVSRGFLNAEGNKVKIELVARWLVKRHPLWQEVREFEKRDQQEIKESYEILNQIHQVNKKGITAKIFQHQQESNILENHILNESLQSVSEGVFSFKGKDNTKALVNKIYLATQENKLLILILGLGIGAIAAFIAIISPMMNDHPNDEHSSPPIESNGSR
ncbi:AAA-like domain-containing protein [Nostoc sp. UHCC 0870]|uniref:AAA-like domain-containing protein n=1 Tax=Nostoc sp. UHCC 0870 TaxID=2914041 RepID=UPI001EDF0349|nr:ATP-binding protein [Nostoc sp. UHCC 0870]UKP00033.1 ATP-binding protein [Nostoc sp. UHCC 0870]